MEVQEIVNIAICATGAAIDALACAVREAGRWSLIPIEWPDPAALVAARQTARALVVCADGITA
jgi:hypothetical protein